MVYIHISHVCVCVCVYRLVITVVSRSSMVGKGMRELQVLALLHAPRAIASAQRGDVDRICYDAFALSLSLSRVSLLLIQVYPLRPSYEWRTRKLHYTYTIRPLAIASSSSSSSSSSSTVCWSERNPLRVSYQCICVEAFKVELYAWGTWLYAGITLSACLSLLPSL